MKDLEEQCVCERFCFKLGKTFTETFEMLQQAYGEDCLSCMQCYKWYQHFKLGRISIDDDPKSGQPSTSTDDDHAEKVHAVIHENRCLTVHEVSEKVGTCKSSCRTILTEKTEDASSCCKICATSADRGTKREPHHSQSGAV
jgi:hypothetical protein